MTKSLGQIAYEGYFEQCGGRSLISGQSLPEWTGLSSDIRMAWEAAGNCVAESLESSRQFALVDSRIYRGGKERGGALIRLFGDLRDAGQHAVQRLIDEEEVIRRVDGGIRWVTNDGEGRLEINDYEPGEDGEFLAEFQMSVQATEYFHIYPVGVEDDGTPQPTEERDDD